MLSTLLTLFFSTALASDSCAEQSWYGGGLCDADCPLPDLDCGG